MRKVLYEWILPQKNLTGDTMNSHKTELLALDLDGTMLKSDVTLSPKVKSSIQRAIENGIEVVAASGRPFASMPDCVLKIEGINYSITSNGAAIYDKNGVRVYSSLINEVDVIKLLDITQNYDLIFEAFIDGLTYTDIRYVQNPIKYGGSKAYIDYVRSSHGHIKNMRRFIYDHRTELDSIVYVCSDKNLRDLIRSKIAYNTNFFITSSSENYVEFSAKNATKANAVKYVCKALGIKRENTAACGNADNDADMIKWANLGAAVSNASPLCLDCADILVASNDDDGVAELINYILNNN